MSVEKIETWNIGKRIAVETYRLTRLLPKEEVFALSAQMRRAAISIPSNVAEGYGRESTRDYVKFLSYAKGSAIELRTQIEIALEVAFFKEEETEFLLQLLNIEIKKLSKQIVSLNKNLLSSEKH